MALLLPLGAAPSLGLDAEREITQYRMKSWGQEQGLPQNSIRAIAQTPDGFLWLGTEEGLVRFDGIRFEVFTRANTETLTSSRVIDLQTDGRGRLWVATYEGDLLCRQPDGRFARPEPMGAASPASPNALCLGTAGETVWIGAREGGPRQVHNGRLRPWPGPPALALRPARAITADGAEGVWLGTDAGVYHLPATPGEAQSFTEAEGLPNGQVQALLRTASGELWAGTRAGLARLDGGANRFVPVAVAELGGQAIIALGEDRDGNLWAGTLKGGVWRRRAGTDEWQGLRVRDGLPDDRILKIFEDREGNLWLATGGGLCRLADVNFATFATAEGLPDDQARVVMASRRDGSVWVGTPNGLGRQGPSDHRFRPEDSPPARSGKEGLGSFVISLFEDATGALCFGTADYLLRRRAAPGAGPDALPGAPEEIALAGGAGTMCERVPGEFWAGTSAGLYRFERGRQTGFYTAKEGLASNAVLALCADGEGGLWIGTRGGLNRWRDGAIETVPTADGRPLTGRVAALFLDAANTLWVGTIEQGIRRRLPGQLLSRACTARQGLFHDTAYVILEAGDRLWMSCNQGVYSVPKAELAEFFDERRGAVNCVSYGTSDGMRSAECNGAFNPAGCRDAAGRLWFPTTKGVVRVDPARLRRNAVLPPVLVERLMVDDEAPRLNPAGAETLHLGPGVRRLQFDYAGLSLTAPERVRYRYRLVGFDPGWVDAGTRRAAFYTALPPGDYRFEVRACNNDGVWNDAGAALAFVLRPRFYQTSWFAALAALAAVLAGAGAFWLRQRQLHARFAAVLAERTRIARELHDTCAQALFAVGFELNSAQDEVAEGTFVRERLQGALGVVRQGLADARTLIAELRGQTAREQPAGDLRAALAEFVQTVNTDALDFTLEVDSHAVALLAPEARHEVLRVCQEAIHNALKHADAQSVAVQVGFDAARPGWVCALVQDDGRGFPGDSRATSPDRPAGSFGLRGMQERAAQAGGSLKVESAPDAGTQVWLRVPFGNEKTSAEKNPADGTTAS